jgi:hypothetical protein
LNPRPICLPVYTIRRRCSWKRRYNLRTLPSLSFSRSISLSLSTPPPLSLSLYPSIYLSTCIQRSAQLSLLTQTDTPNCNSRMETSCMLTLGEYSCFQQFATGGLGPSHRKSHAAFPANRGAQDGGAGRSDAGRSTRPTQAQSNCPAVYGKNGIVCLNTTCTTIL